MSWGKNMADEVIEIVAKEDVEVARAKIAIIFNRLGNEFDAVNNGAIEQARRLQAIVNIASTGKVEEEGEVTQPAGDPHCEVVAKGVRYEVSIPVIENGLIKWDHLTGTVADELEAFQKLDEVVGIIVAGGPSLRGVPAIRQRATLPDGFVVLSMALTPPVDEEADVGSES